MIRKIILGFVVLSFFIWNVFAYENEKTYTTKDSLWNTRIVDRDTNEVIKTIWAAEKWWNETINAVNSWNKETTDAAVSKAQQDAEAAKQPSWWTDTSTSNTTTTSSNISSADYKKWIDAAQKNLDAAKAELNAGPPTQETLDKIANAEAALKTYQDAYNSTLAKEKAQEAARDAACESSWDCLDKPSFVINTRLFSTSGEWLKTWEAKSTINGILGTIIQKLMIALWIIALFVMTVWAWYMILFRWEDEYLSKWKNIFIWWITALIVALSSYYLVNLVWYILYK